MNFGRKIFAYLFAAAVVAGLGSCRSSRTPSSEAGYGMAAEPSLPGRTLASDYRMMTAAYTPWTDLSVPVKVSVSKPKKVSVSGTLSMVYGKVLSLSLKMLFFEVGTVYIDTDSVLVVSRPAGAYYSESLDRFTASTGFSLSDVQSLLLGQLFSPGNGTATLSEAADYELSERADLSDNDLTAWRLTPRRTVPGVAWSFTAISPRSVTSSASPQLFALDAAAEAGTVACTFAQSELSPAGVIASMMQIKGTVKKHSIDAVISASSSKARWNSGLSVSRPSIPEGARRMTTEQVFRLLNKL